MVFLTWEGEDPGRYADFSQALRADGLMVVAIPNRGIRIVFHKDVSEESAQQAGEILTRHLRGLFLE